MGRLSSDTRNGNSSLASTYTYNIRSWVTGISGTLFTEQLKYQDVTPKRWGGDISKISWKDNRNSTYDSYAFTYDGIGRLLNASYTDHTNDSSVKFSENVTYDTSGNIQSLERYGRTGSSSYGKIDNLAYSYSGNKLSSVKDTGSAGYSSDFRFSDGTNTTYSYTYDTAGRMTADASKGISSITWIIISQPQAITFSDGSTISYKYAADGTKLQEVKTVSGNTATTDYLGNLVVENSTNSRLLFGNGYVTLSDNAYHYFITDHLGSVRVVASSTGMAEEYNHYYPLGGLLPSSSSSTGIQPIKFQGKEWGAGNGVDLNLYDFGARRYDPSIGRWLSQDPLAEKYYGHTPYLFCLGNPMNILDPNGTDDYDFKKNGEWTKHENEDPYDRLVIGDKSLIVKDKTIMSSMTEHKYILGTELPPDERRLHYSLVSSKSEKEVKSVFKFLADNTDAEWLLIKGQDNSLLLASQHLIHIMDENAIYTYLKNEGKESVLDNPIYRIHNHPYGYYESEIKSMEVDVINYKNNPNTTSYVYFNHSSNLYRLTFNGPLVYKQWK